jgi:ribosome-binding protein aMBF1 (putative translation factor)
MSLNAMNERCENCGTDVPWREAVVLKVPGMPVTVCENCAVDEPHPEEPTTSYAGP